jgi:hypothetical protein
MKRNNKILPLAGWTKAEARRKREFERHAELQAKREANSQNPAFDENGRLKPGLTYPASDFDEDLVPDCPSCIAEGCDWTPSEDETAVKIHHTCGNPACDEARAAMLQGQKQFDEAISEDFTVSIRDGGAA